MKIVYLANVRIPTEKAFGLAMMRQCEAFSKLGNKVIFVRARRKNHLNNDVFEYYGIKNIFDVISVPVIQLYVALGMAGFYLTRISMMLTATWYVWLNRSSINIIYSRDSWLLFFPLLVTPRIKTVFEAHTKHSDLVTRYVVKHTDSVVVISSGLKQFYKKIREEKDIFVEPSGVDVEQFQNLPPQTIVRDKFGLPKDSFIYGYMGKYTTMGEEKGVDEVIKAFAEVNKSRPNTHLLIVGLEETEVKIVERVIGNLKLSLGTYTLRPLDPKSFAEYAHACDVLVMNYPDTEHYRYFMSPSKLFAYLASGRPIIATNLPSINSVVSDCVVTLVTPGDTPALARAMMNETKGDYTNSINKKRAEYYSWHNRGKRILSYMNKSVNYEI